MTVQLTKRPPADDYFMMMAQVAALRGTCIRRRVGCVLVNVHKHIVSTGYNGPASGMPHCYETPCGGQSHESGAGLGSCEAIHAEANALLQCPDVLGIDTVYCTASPCVDCVKLLMNTSAKRIVFLEKYPHERSQELWIRHGGEWVQHPWGKEYWDSNPLRTLQAVCL